MTTLSDIRVIETRLHSHLLEWDDILLQNELLFVLDELQDIHTLLDGCQVPNCNMNGEALSLIQRITYLARRSDPAKNQPHNHQERSTP